MRTIEALALVHADDALVAVDKPAGLLAVPGRGADKQDCASARVQRHFADALIVHRLDQATSGLLVLARGAPAQRALSRAFAERRVRKRYEAVVEGLLHDDEGEIDLPLAADWPNRPLQRVDRVRGRPALTRWRVLARDASASTTRLALEPVTGRSHQLRVHLASIGHPIAGDGLYGCTAQGLRAQRLLLHAAALTLPHPVHDQLLELAAPLPF